MAAQTRSAVPTSPSVAVRAFLSLIICVTTIRVLSRTISVAPDFFFLHPLAQVQWIEHQRRPGRPLDVGELAGMRQFPQEPLAHSEKPCRFPAPNEALKCRLRLAFHRATDLRLSLCQRLASLCSPRRQWQYCSHTDNSKRGWIGRGVQLSSHSRIIAASGSRKAS